MDYSWFGRVSSPSTDTLIAMFLYTKSRICFEFVQDPNVYGFNYFDTFEKSLIEMFYK